MKLQIGTSNHGKFSFPLNAVTETFAVLAKKGYGKSYVASVLAEEMLKASQQIVAIDPTGAWFGLQSSADGKSEGFPIVIFGGDHANVPLEELAGEIVAQAVVEHGFSCIIDLSLLRKGAANKFMGLFLETLYRLNRTPLHLFVDEADTFAPQRPFGEEARTLGAMEDIVKKGRRRGIGTTLITQRPQTINKNVLTQVDTLITGNLSHPKDIGAIIEWVNVHATKEEAAAMTESLPMLKKEEKWFWSPSWGQFFERVKVRKRETFDSGATPKPGEKILQPKKLAEVDIAALGKAIQETAERKKADDPKRLKQRIAELEREKKVPTPVVASSAQIQTAVSKAEASRDKFWEREVAKVTKAFGDYRSAIVPKLESLLKISGNGIMPTIEKPKASEIPTTKIVDASRIHTNGHAKAAQSSAALGGGGLFKILLVCAQYPEGATPEQIALLTGYKATSRRIYLNQLRANGYVEEGGGGWIATDAGIGALGDNYEPLPTGDSLRAYWLNKLGGGEKIILENLIDAWPNGLTRERLSESTNYKDTSLRIYTNQLKARKLVEDSDKGVKASDILFD